MARLGEGDLAAACSVTSEQGHRREDVKPVRRRALRGVGPAEFIVGRARCACSVDLAGSSGVGELSFSRTR